jgi:hypothetical protein
MTPENNLREHLFRPFSQGPRQLRELAQIVGLGCPASELYYKFCLVCLVIGLPGATCGLIFRRWAPLDRA